MAEYAFPPVSEGPWRNGIEIAQEKLPKFINQYYDAFGSMPDERGLTDQLLLYLQVNNARIHIEKPSQYDEGKSGVDYRWSFTCYNQQHKQEKIVYIQAKTYKDKVANFMFKKGQQMDNLSKTIADARVSNDSAIVIGGYLMYGGGTTGLQFIDIDSLKRTRATKGIQSDNQMDKLLSDFYYKSHDENVQNIYHAMPQK